MAERRARFASAQTPVRILAALIFVGAGVRKFIGNGVVIEDFGRWNVPAPEVSVYLIGAMELIGGLLLLAGVRPGLVAAVLGVEMAFAAALAGPADPLPHLVLPLVLICACAFIAWEARREGAIASPP